METEIINRIQKDAEQKVAQAINGLAPSLNMLKSFLLNLETMQRIYEPLLTVNEAIKTQTTHIQEANHVFKNAIVPSIIQANELSQLLKNSYKKQIKFVEAATELNRPTKMLRIAPSNRPVQLSRRDKEEISQLVVAKLEERKKPKPRKTTEQLIELTLKGNKLYRYSVNLKPYELSPMELAILKNTNRDRYTSTKDIRKLIGSTSEDSVRQIVNQMKRKINAVLKIKIDILEGKKPHGYKHHSRIDISEFASS